MAFRPYFQSGVSTFWNPSEAGSSIEGVIEKHEIVTGQDKKDFVQTTLVNRKTGEEILVASSKRGLEQLQTVPKGVLVRLTFTGLSEKKYAGGNHMKYYSCDVDGKFKPIEPLLIRAKKSAKKSAKKIRK